MNKTVHLWKMSDWDKVPPAQLDPNVDVVPHWTYWIQYWAYHLTHHPISSIQYLTKRR